MASKRGDRSRSLVWRTLIDAAAANMASDMISKHLQTKEVGRAKLKTRRKEISETGDELSKLRYG